MNTDNLLVQIYSYYDKLIAPLPLSAQTLISLGLVVFLVWQIYMFVKSGQWIFLVVILFLSPGTWPALRKLGELIYQILKFLLDKAK